jgi:hypothetical protein
VYSIELGIYCRKLHWDKTAVNFSFFRRKFYIYIQTNLIHYMKIALNTIQTSGKIGINWSGREGSTNVFVGMNKGWKFVPLNSPLFDRWLAFKLELLTYMHGSWECCFLVPCPLQHFLFGFGTIAAGSAHCLLPILATNLNN